MRRPTGRRRGPAGFRRSTRTRRPLARRCTGRRRRPPLAARSGLGRGTGLPASPRAGSRRNRASRSTTSPHRRPSARRAAGPTALPAARPLERRSVVLSWQVRALRPACAVGPRARSGAAGDGSGTRARVSSARARASRRAGRRTPGSRWRPRGSRPLARGAAGGRRRRGAVSSDRAGRGGPGEASSGEHAGGRGRAGDDDDQRGCNGSPPAVGHGVQGRMPRWAATRAGGPATGLAAGGAGLPCRGSPGESPIRPRGRGLRSGGILADIRQNPARRENDGHASPVAARVTGVTSTRPGRGCPERRYPLSMDPSSGSRWPCPGPSSWGTAGRGGCLDADRRGSR